MFPSWGRQYNTLSEHVRQIGNVDATYSMLGRTQGMWKQQAFPYIQKIVRFYGSFVLRWSYVSRSVCLVAYCCLRKCHVICKFQKRYLRTSIWFDIGLSFVSFSCDIIEMVVVYMVHIIGLLFLWPIMSYVYSIIFLGLTFSGFIRVPLFRNAFASLQFKGFLCSQI